MVEESLIEITEKRMQESCKRLGLELLPVAWLILRHAEHHLRWHTLDKNAAEMATVLFLEGLQYDDEVRRLHG